MVESGSRGWSRREVLKAGAAFGALWGLLFPESSLVILGLVLGFFSGLLGLGWKRILLGVGTGLATGLLMTAIAPAINPAILGGLVVGLVAFAIYWYFSPSSEWVNCDRGCTLNLAGKAILTLPPEGISGPLKLQAGDIPAVELMARGVEDDPADDIGFPTSAWTWANCCTDGGAISPLGSSFDITITPDFNPTVPAPLNPGTIDFWKFLTGSGEEILDMDKAITIRGAGSP